MNDTPINRPAQIPVSSAPALRTAEAPPLTVAALADRFPVSAAATRFLSRPEIEDRFTMGSNGLCFHMPTSPEGRLVLYRSLPPPEASHQMSKLIKDALAHPAMPGEASAAIRAILDGWQKLDPQVAAIAVPLLIEETVARDWPMAAIVGGLIALLKTQKFPPAVAEMIESIQLEHSRLNTVRVIALKAADAFADLENRLIASGHLVPEEEE